MHVQYLHVGTSRPIYHHQLMSGVRIYLQLIGGNFSFGAKCNNSRKNAQGGVRHFAVRVHLLQAVVHSAGSGVS
jgi:hypothetical protein